jgi:ATP-binding cassette, subfamily B, bacterial MsbA
MVCFEGSSVVRQDWALYKRLMGWARPYWRIAALSVLAMICTAALEPVLPALMQPLIDKSLIAKHATAIWQVPVFIVLAFLVKGVADYVGNVASQYLAQRVVADLRDAVFEHQLYLPLYSQQAGESGRMLSRVTYDTTMVGEAVSTAWITVIRDTLVLCGLVGFLFYTSWLLALAVFFVAPALAWAIRKASGRLRETNRSVQEGMGSLTGFVEQTLAGLREIKIFNGFQSQADQFSTRNQKLRRDQMRVVRVLALNVPMVQVLAACSVALVIYVASLLSSANKLSPGEFVAFITAMSMVFEPVRRLTNVNAVIQRGLAATESIFELLDQPAELKPLRQLPTVPAKALNGQISFEGVTFAYPGRDPVFSGFNLEIQPGELVALTGPSGAGKSTLFHLTAGFLLPQSGQIRIDGKSIGELGLHVVRQNISLVSQRIVLFNGSIRQNILMGAPLASEQALRQAASDANALGFIEALPLGFDTVIGDSYADLSGGQRQRIAIARAFLKNSPILLLDEATSALDADNQDQILQAMERLVRGRTVLMISHGSLGGLVPTQTVELV